MKKKALAIVLAICMVLSMLPMTAFAASRTGIAGHDLPFAQAPAGLKADFKPIGTAEPNAKEYTLTLRATANGDTGATADSAAKGDSIYILANPDPGYLAYFDTYGDDLELYYIGYDMYELVMPGHDVSIDIYYEAAEGPSYDVTVKAADDCVWYTMDNVTSAKEYESVILSVEERDSYTFDPETDVTANCEDFYYLGYFEEEARHVYELFMPAKDVKITINTTPVVKTYDVDMAVINRSLGYWEVESGKTAKAGDTVTIYAEPLFGCKLEEIYVQGGPEIKSIGNHRYTFTMPARNVLVYVTFAENINPVTVTVDTGLGGTASLNVSKAQEGDTVTLVCAPEEGYRVAQITGVNRLVDNGDNTYTFPMPGKAVDLHVLFLREENPFLDVNETHFFYDPVLWAVEEGITNGIDDTHFGPFLTINRAAAVTMLWRYAGSPEPSGTDNPFTDVPDDSWFAKPVLWAVENGITNGVSADTFAPNLSCNRAQVVTFLWRFLGQPESGITEHPFTDVEAGSFYEQPVLWALENNITTGATATTFNPVGDCMRAQFVTFLYRTSQLPAYYDVNWVLNGFVNTPSEYGTVTLSHTRAMAGTVITATVVPNEGYVLDWVKCEFGTPVTQISDTEYTFVMPEHAENFHVNFSEAPEEPEPTVTYDLILKDNGYGTVAYVDNTSAAPGESIFFYAVPDEGFYLEQVEIFNPNNEIDINQIRVYDHGDDLYELVMIDHEIVMTCIFAPISGT